MKDVVIKRQEMLILLPNQRYSLPDAQADLAIARGVAVLIADDILAQEAKERLAASEKSAKERCEQAAVEGMKAGQEAAEHIEEKKPKGKK